MPRAASRLGHRECAHLASLLPRPPAHHPNYAFRFVDLFAGIGGIRNGFEAINGQCVFTSEWNKHAVRTYKANWYCDPEQHRFNADIRDITLSHRLDISDEDAARHIRDTIPQHDVLLAGFPCQPFSLAGVSKKNALGRAHGFACETQGTLFFDVVRIIAARRPPIFVLENVKNLKSHDKGERSASSWQTLDELGYEVSDAGHSGADDPRLSMAVTSCRSTANASCWLAFVATCSCTRGLPCAISPGFTRPSARRLASCSSRRWDAKFILTPVLWKYLYRYARKHQALGNGFGYGLSTRANPHSVARTLSARYYKDGAEILIDRGWDRPLGEKDFDDPQNQQRRPRRLTPRECARLMGFESPQGYRFRIPVSDTQAYRPVRNSVVVPVFAAVARLAASRELRRRWPAAIPRMMTMDVHDKATRSKNMRAIGTFDTAIENDWPDCSRRPVFLLPLRRLRCRGARILWSAITAALSLPTAASWHHHDCYLFKVPATRTAFWLNKIDGNVTRDRRDEALLLERGWRVLIVWECALRGKKKLSDEALSERLEEWICGGGHRAQIDTQGIGP
ncbi:DNA-cytosine methyltransferase [Raoultella terrigena]|uniref:Cytosine-specific methyltransferase n=1 Tax=Raoultella terrigena TaxID=577 RepID=A0A4U9D1S7_RAOTE|nr:DNA-cytosine methyltransferase [Raoultella terrigena]